MTAEDQTIMSATLLGFDREQNPFLLGLDFCVIPLYNVHGMPQGATCGQLARDQHDRVRAQLYMRAT